MQAPSKVVEKCLEALRKLLGASSAEKNEWKVLSATATAWRDDRRALGSYSFLAPGCIPDDVDALAAPCWGGVLRWAPSTPRGAWRPAAGAWNLAGLKADGSLERQDCYRYPTTRTRRGGPTSPSRSDPRGSAARCDIRVMCEKARQTGHVGGCLRLMRFEEWRRCRRRGLHGGSFAGLRARFKMCGCTTAVRPLPQKCACWMTPGSTSTLLYPVVGASLVQLVARKERRSGCISASARIVTMGSAPRCIQVGFTFAPSFRLPEALEARVHRVR